MYHSSRQGLFPWFPILTGMVGFALRCWLFSSMDSAGLLPNNHIAGSLTFLLLALCLAVCFLGVKNATPHDTYRQMFPRSGIAAAGTVMGAVGMAISAFTLKSAGVFRFLLPVLGVLCAGALLFAAYCRFRELQPNFLTHCAVAIYLIFRSLANCRTWGAEPQLQLYFFHLLASLFLLLACYYRAELDLHSGDCRRYVFFAQAALFCCCLCLMGEGWLFYLSAGIWIATDFCVIFPENKNR